MQRAALQGSRITIFNQTFMPGQALCQVPMNSNAYLQALLPIKYDFQRACSHLTVLQKTWMPTPLQIIYARA